MKQQVVSPFFFYLDYKVSLLHDKTLMIDSDDFIHQQVIKQIAFFIRFHSECLSSCLMSHVIMFI